MSTPSNPSSIMIYKIIKDFEYNKTTIHTLDELFYFSQQVFDLANTISKDAYWILETPKIYEDLLKLCDLTDSVCELSTTKYENGGKAFATTKTGLMPYPWYKAALTILKNYYPDKDETDTLCK